MQPHENITNQKVSGRDRIEGWEEIPLRDHPRTAIENAEGSRLIPLSQGKFAIVDSEDFERLNKFKWCFCKYAKRFIRCDNSSRKAIWMHRVINQTPDGFDTDHINGNKLDNRKCNLRTVTRSQNEWNKLAPRNNTSGMKGVNFNKSNRKWVARISISGSYLYLGCYPTKQLAYEAYCIAQRKHHGSFARTADNATQG